jgi:hypothetical protein
LRILEFGKKREKFEKNKTPEGFKKSLNFYQVDGLERAVSLLINKKTVVSVEIRNG